MPRTAGRRGGNGRLARHCRAGSTPAMQNFMPSLRGGQTRSLSSATLESWSSARISFPVCPKELRNATVSASSGRLRCFCVDSFLVDGAGRVPGGEGGKTCRSRSRSSSALRSMASIPRGQARRASSAIWNRRWRHRATHRRRRRRQGRVGRLVEDRRLGRRPRQDLRAARRDRPAAQGQQAGLRRTDHRRHAASICWPRPAIKS